MRFRHAMLASCAIVLAGQAFAANDELMKTAQDLFQPIPEDPPELEGNPSTPERVELGKMLYFEPRLSESHAISCNTCHIVGLGGVDMLQTSIGHEWQMGPRNAPTVLNAVFNTAQFWDGRAKDLQEQAGGPIVNPIEMASSREHVIEQLSAIPGYPELLKAAFPDASDPVSVENVEKAIALYEATLITPNAPFDRYLEGDADALSQTEKEGLQLFVDTGCASCHSGINLGGQMYAPFGVVEKPGADILPPEDKGRFEVTRTASDEYVFKVPTLRNIERTLPYFHSGKVWDLKQAVAIMGVSQLGQELSDEDAEKITAFLKTLTGDQPAVMYPILPTSVGSTPKPKP